MALRGTATVRPRHGQDAGRSSNSSRLSSSSRHAANQVAAASRASSRTGTNWPCARDHGEQQINVDAAGVAEASVGREVRGPQRPPRTTDDDAVCRVVRPARAEGHSLARGPAHASRRLCLSRRKLAIDEADGAAGRGLGERGGGHPRPGGRLRRGEPSLHAARRLVEPRRRAPSAASARRLLEAGASIGRLERGVARAPVRHTPRHTPLSRPRRPPARRCARRGQGRHATLRD